MSAAILVLPNVVKGEMPERNEAFSPWQRTTWIWAGGLVVIAALAGLVGYLFYSRRRLKLAEKKRLQLGGMLISAQEKERSRLASELHDDFSQRLALLAYGLENVAEAIPASAEEANRRLQNLAHTASEIGADLHTLSHRLHSSTLENLGLVPGVAALCKEFTAQQGIAVDFRHEDIPRTVQPEVALCLFRIVQEGLRNLRKHSGAQMALVRLDKRGDDLHVVVGDKGIGFDVKELRERNGLGIRSMEERAQMLGGRFKIHSELGKGTRVEAWIPLREKAGLTKI
jgi:signal transduction histidine kinase